MKEHENEKVRIDKYLWAVRIFHTRAEAAAACGGGKVKTAGKAVKASRTVHAGDEYEIVTPARKWVIRVTATLGRRAGYAETVKHYVDLTPEKDAAPQKKQASSFYTGKRLSKVGRPTKKQRRDLDDFTGEAPR
jgi:ribosome-associated heat shock protein Hsp15